MAATSSTIVSGRSVVALRDFRLFVAGSFFGTLAIQIQSVAVSWQIYGITHSPMALGYAGLVQFLPMVACILPSGHLADRFDRRLIITISYFLQAVCAGLFLAIALANPHDARPFYVILALFGAARTVSRPAAQSFVPLLVPTEQFPQAVAWSSSAFQTAVIAGPAVGGAIYLLGPTAAYGVCFALFLVVTLITISIRSRSAPNSAEAEMTGVDRMTAGIRYVFSKPMILGAITLDLFAVLLGGATALLPIYASDILHVGPTGLGFLRSAPAAGAAILGLVLGNMPLRRSYGISLFSAVAMFGVATIAFGVSKSFVLSLAALAVLGASDMVSVYVRSTLIQLATPDAMRGRVSAVNGLFIGASNELGEFESGMTATWFGTVPAVVIGGIGTLIVVGAGLWLFPALRKVDRLSDVTIS